MPTQRGFRLYATALWGLTALFCLRILAQPLSQSLPSLPGFDAWQGSLLPYPALLFFQLVIAITMILINLRLARGDLVPRRFLGDELGVKQPAPIGDGDAPRRGEDAF